MKGNKKKLFIYIFLLISVLFLFGFSVFDIALRQYIYLKKLREFPFRPKVASYPGFVLGDKFEPNISAKAAIAMDNDSKVILYSKNPNLLFSMASTTKIMTALVALMHYKANDILTIKSEDVEGAKVGFREGQKFLFEDLLYAMLLPSGNDAALAIAQNYPGGLESFVEKMNEKAHALNLYNTHFADPAGLNDSNDYTTVLDLAKLSSFALQNKTFARIVGTKSITISDINKENTYTITNLNKLLGTNGVSGVKTGFTNEAGQVLVTSKVENNHTLIFVVMGSLDRFLDTNRLLYLISGNINYLSIHP